MAVDAPNKTPAELEQEKRDREAALRQPQLPSGGLFSLFNQSPSFNSGGGFMGGLMGMLTQFLQMIFGGGGLGGLFGNMGRSVSDFGDALNGRGDTPLAPKGTKPNTSLGNTIGTTLRSGWNGVLDLIGKHESGGDYNRVYGAGVKRADLTNMTIDQVQEWQKQYVRSGSPSAAVGKYQIITKTLAALEKQMGLTGKEKFDEAMQDRMAMQLLKNRGITPETAKTMTTGQIVNAISKEWASIENTKGRGHYDGDGLNRAVRGSGKQMEVALQAARNGDDPGRSSVASMIDTPGSGSGKASRTPSAAADMSKVASAGATTPNDPVADRKIVKAGNGAPVFVASYDGSPGKETVASVTIPDLNPTRIPGATPKV